SKGEKRKSVFLYFLAIIFHLSALLGVPVWVLTLRGFRVRSRLWLALLVPLALVLKYALRNILQLLADFSRISPYINGGYETEKVKVFTAYFVIRVAALLFVVIVYWGRLSAEQRLATLCSSIGIFLLVALSANDALALRSADVFGLFELVVFIIPLQFIKGHLRLIYALFIVLLGIGFFEASLDLIGPYQWVFS
ncbi:MAG TPA: EpsG family protein, partial [Acidobacteriaceae bacterium]|nr:EpsG family protein [Acidobacteriaceae bacterium]